MLYFDLSDFIIDAYLTIGGTSLFYGLFFPPINVVLY